MGEAPETPAPGAPLDRVAAFEQEMILLADRAFNEGGLDLVQVLGTIEWVKHRMIRHLSDRGDAEAESTTDPETPDPRGS